MLTTNSQDKKLRVPFTIETRKIPRSKFTLGCERHAH